MAEYGTCVHEISITKMICGKCAGVFGLNEEWRSRRKREGGSWHCPYCQEGWSYIKTTLDETREQLALEQQRLTYEKSQHDQTRSELNRTERCRRAEKAAKTKLKNRVSKGVCPCCNRHFVNLQRHMKSKHSGWK